MLFDLRCCGFVRQVLLRRRGEAPVVSVLGRPEMLSLVVNCYRVEMAIADDTAAGTFVWFDGVMKKLHNLRASEAVQMLAEDGVNSEDSRRLGYLRSFQIWKESQYTFQVRVTAYNLPGNHKTLIFSIVDELGRVRDDDVGDNGGNEDDDDNMPNGKPAPVGFASGRATGNGSDGSIRYCA
ncbi:unnamed protein product [Brassica rapa subsp. narinosa]